MQSLLAPENHQSTDEFQPVRILNGKTTGDLAAKRMLCTLLDYRSGTVGDPEQTLAGYLTDDPEIIRYRQEVVGDILEYGELYDLLDGLYFDLMDIDDIVNSRNRSEETETQLYKIKELTLFLKCADALGEFFCRPELRLRSAGLKEFARRIRTLTGSDEYRALHKNCKKLYMRVESIKSVTIGANLDGKLAVSEAGIVSVNDKPFRSGKLIDRMIRMDFEEDGFLTLVPLSHQSGTDIRLNTGVLKSLSEIFLKNTAKMSSEIHRYTALSAGLLLNFSEIRFYLGAVRFIRAMKKTGLPMCRPEISEDGTSRIRGFYNVQLALNQMRADTLEKNNDFYVVQNDIDFDRQGALYILTGPNSGGKTVFLQGVGLAQILFQLGLYVPASSAVIRPADALLTHFSDREDAAGKTGRLGLECENIRRILDTATERSLVLINEPFSSTSFSEGTVLCGEVLKVLGAVGAAGILVTHFHELAEHASQFNGKNSKSRVDTLTAGVSESRDADGFRRRTYKITRSRPDFMSYARDIALRYGVDADQILRAKSAGGA